FGGVSNFGMFRCVNTASTPGTACAAFVSIAVIFPFAMLLSTVQPYAHFGAVNSTAYFAAPVTFNRPSTRLRAGPIVAALMRESSFWGAHAPSRAGHGALAVTHLMRKKSSRWRGRHRRHARRVRSPEIVQSRPSYHHSRH